MTKTEGASVVAATGNIMRVKEPRFLTLTGAPANGIGFKTVRHDGREEIYMSKRIVRQTRSDGTQGGVVALTFPAGTTAEQAQELLTTFGFTGLNITCNDTGVVSALRSDLKSISEAGATSTIKISDDGLMATVVSAGASSGVPGVAVTCIEFDATRFDDAAATAWLDAKGVGEADVSRTDSAIRVVRLDTEGEVETRMIEVEPGVIATVVRADAADIPSGLFEIVSEAAYGNYGWGMLDFDQSMADAAFSDAMDDAMYRLRNVLNRILFYSELPLDLRKTLVARATAQFGVFVNAQIDALPKTVLAMIQSKLVQTPAAAAPVVIVTEELEANTVVIQNSDDGAGDEKGDKQEIDESSTAPLTRDDLAAIIRTEVQSAMAEVNGRGVDVKEEVPGETTVNRSDLGAIIAEAVAPLERRIAELSEGVTLRSDAGDAAQVVVEPVTRNVFSGAIPGVSRSNRK